MLGKVIVEKAKLTKAQQRAIDALNKQTLIVPLKNGAPYIFKNKMPLRIQTKTYLFLKEHSLIEMIKYRESDKTEFYRLSQSAWDLLSDPKTFGTPRRYKR